MRFFFLLLMMATAFLSCSEEGHYADRIYINAVVWTGEDGGQQYSAIGLKDSIVLFVGDDYNVYAGPETEIIDVGGQFIVPGFIDNHTHFLSGGFQLASVDLRSATTKQAFIDSIKTFAQRLPEGRWILGGDWDHEVWGGELPDRSWIDSFTRDIPVFVNRYDGHMALANTAALKIAGITENTKAPAGGEIQRRKGSNIPTGLLRDEAMDLVSAKIPPFTDAMMDENLDRAIQEAWRNGVTQIHDMGSYGGWIDLDTYRRAKANNKLGIRVYSFVALRTWAKLDSLIKKEGKGDDRLFWGGLKGFVDGSLGSTTAWFYEPYLDAPNTSGLLVSDTAWLRRQILSADSAGLQLAIHAIGDRANDWLLDVYASALASSRHKDKRFRIEHAQHLSAAALPRFHELGVIPSMQPYHAIDDGRWAAKRLDDDRLRRTYAFKSLLNHRAGLTFGSDWTVAPLSPILGIYAAVTRSTLDNKNPDGWYPEEKLTVEEALRAYTVNNAFAGFMENKTGKLLPGYYADIAILSHNLFEIPSEEIKNVRVMRTVVNGKEVYKN
jgi:predicted amidohydrolase YtcJ